MRFPPLASVLLMVATICSLSSLGPAQEGDGVLTLQVLWSRPVGSAYSRVVGDADVLVTQGSDGAHDFVVALETSSGNERWRYLSGDTYRGHDGSADGPVSTPVLGAEYVYAIEPLGRLVALRVASGELAWSKHLVNDLGAEAPEYGFTSTPVLHQGLLIVQVGGSEGRNICAFDSQTGELRWATGEGVSAYESPTLMHLAGREQLVVKNGAELLGLAPESGQILWSQRSGPASADDRDAAGGAGQIDDGSFFVFDGAALVVHSIQAQESRFKVDVVSKIRELGNTYAMPVYHQGFFYGYKSSFLTCVDALSGKRQWKSRPPGGRGLVLVGGHLIVFGSEGVVAVVRATPEGYVEESRVQALEMSGYTWPSLIEGKIVVRNAEQVACLEALRVAPADSPTPAAALASPPAPSRGALAEILKRVTESATPTPPIEALLAGAQVPIVEDGQVHFLFQGDVEDVGIAGSMTGGSAIDSMQRIGNTNVYFRSYPILPGARWEYWFHVDYNRGSTDPLNPNQVQGERGEVSEVLTPSYVRKEHVNEPTEGIARGRLEPVEFESEQLQNKRTLQVYLPSVYDQEPQRHFPVVLVHDGPEWLSLGHLPNTLDNLIGKTVAPVIVVFIEAQQQWWFEASGSRTEPYLAMLATELMPFLAERYRLSDAPADHALFGIMGFGVTAALGVAKHSDVFGKAAMQSVTLEDVAQHALFRHLAELPARAGEFYLDWNFYESSNVDRNSDFARDSRRLADAIQARGCSLAGGEALDCHGWPSWRQRSDVWLESFFPLNGSRDR